MSEELGAQRSKKLHPEKIFTFRKSESYEALKKRALDPTYMPTSSEESFDCFCGS